MRNMTENKNFYSTKFVLDLLLIDSLQNTNKENPKTSKKIKSDMTKYWQKYLPQEEAKTLGEAAISRHIHDMNESGLYSIKTCEDTKKGYYNEKFSFDLAEFAFIAMALYRSPSISIKETESILNKFINHINGLGKEYLQMILNQIKRTNPRRKSGRAILPIMNKIVYAICQHKKIAFYVYDFNDKQAKNMKLQIDDKGKVIKYKVSPYFLVSDADEYYLIFHDSAKDKNNAHYLSHFNIALISDNVQILTEENTSITKIQEYPRYFLGSTYSAKESERMLKRLQEEAPFNTLKQDEALNRFSLDRYMRENIFMIHDDSKLIDLKIYFREEFIGTLLTQFNLNRFKIRAFFTGEYFDDGTKIFSAVITVQENDSLII